MAIKQPKYETESESARRDLEPQADSHALLRCLKCREQNLIPGRLAALYLTDMGLMKMLPCEHCKERGVLVVDSHEAGV